VIRAIATSTAAVAMLLSGGTAVAGVALDDAAPGAFVKPVSGAWISQGFGCTSFDFEPVDRGCPSGHWHSGVDLACTRGTPVRATLAGVALVTASLSGYGLHVVVDHGGGLTSLYGHLDTVAVSTGTYVDAGTVVGTVGSTGNSTGAHLHFEIRRDGVAEDPRLDMALP
jgi:murein DD-endopeptidase MepM/ murein hydrolase activator NlpD